MEMIELECPSCKELLELDVGFAGGVCRCSTCTILMTVPSKPGVGRAEKLIRPELPTNPDLARTGQEAGPDAGEEKEKSRNQTYLTESGRSIFIEDDTLIPTAQKKKRPAVRATVVAVFAAIMGLVIIGCLFALWVLVVNPVDPKRQGGEEILTHYDPEANPFTLEKPNVVGLPLVPGSAVVIDTSYESRDWSGLVKEALMRGTRFELSSLSLQVVLGTEDGVEVYPEHPAPLREFDAEQLKRFLLASLPMGRADLGQAVEKAMQDQPQQVVLVLGRDLTAAEISAIKQQIKDHADLQLDVLLIGWPISPETEALVDQQSGRRIYLSLQQIKDWHHAGP